MKKQNYRRLAYEKLDDQLAQVSVKGTLRETLMAYPWERLEGKNFSNSDFNQMNLSFDTRSCLPRSLFCVMVGEKFFPETEVKVAEVLEDLFRDFLLSIAQIERYKWNDPTFIAELLMYEEPHFTVVIDGKQFEPLTVGLPLPQEHPKINLLEDTWAALASAHTVSEALSYHAQGDEDRFKASLYEAKELCPQLILVYENLLPAVFAEGDMERTKELIHFLHGKRADAKFLWVAYQITRDKKYLDEFLSTYPQQVFDYITKQAGYGI